MLALQLLIQAIAIVIIVTFLITVFLIGSAAIQQALRSDRRAGR